jgi:RNA polymerase sigma-70 factor (ECF subfamily)
VEAPDDVDGALLDRLCRRDAAAFEWLVRTHQDRVYDFCVRMLADREEASDLAQEIFVSIHANLDKFRRDAKLSTWIFRIARNHCINRLKYLRRRGRGHVEEVGSVPEATLAEAAPAARKPDELIDAQREQELIQKAIARLDEAQRSLVVLRDIEGLSYEEIAEVTDLPMGTVKSRIHRARERLAELVADLSR